MNIPQCLITKNRCYLTERDIVPKGIMLHSVGCSQPDPRVFIRQWDTAEASVAVHAIIGADEYFQLLPWYLRGWHAGSGSKGSANNTHIGIEMTEPSTIKYTGGANFTDLNMFESQEHVRRTYNNAVKVFAELCDFYGFNPETDIISHAEGYQMGIASNHADPTHLWKRYPSLNFSMDGFRKDVKKYMNNKLPTGNNPSPWAKEACDWCIAQGIFQGDGQGNYDWQGAITREQLATILYRMSHK